MACRTGKLDVILVERKTRVARVVEAQLAPGRGRGVALLARARGELSRMGIEVAIRAARAAHASEGTSVRISRTRHVAGLAGCGSMPTLEGEAGPHSMIELRARNVLEALDAVTARAASRAGDTLGSARSVERPCVHIDVTRCARARIGADERRSHIAQVARRSQLGRARSHERSWIRVARRTLGARVGSFEGKPGPEPMVEGSRKRLEALRVVAALARPALGCSARKRRAVEGPGVDIDVTCGALLWRHAEDARYTAEAPTERILDGSAHVAALALRPQVRAIERERRAQRVRRGIEVVLYIEGTRRMALSAVSRTARNGCVERLAVHVRMAIRAARRRAAERARTLAIAEMALVTLHAHVRTVERERRLPMAPEVERVRLEALHAVTGDAALRPSAGIDELTAVRIGVAGSAVIRLAARVARCEGGLASVARVALLTANLVMRSFEGKTAGGVQFPRKLGRRNAPARACRRMALCATRAHGAVHARRQRLREARCVRRRVAVGAAALGRARSASADGLDGVLGSLLVTLRTGLSGMDPSERETLGVYEAAELRKRALLSVACIAGLREATVVRVLVAGVTALRKTEKTGRSALEHLDVGIRMAGFTVEPLMGPNQPERDEVVLEPSSIRHAREREHARIDRLERVAVMLDVALAATRELLRRAMAVEACLGLQLRRDRLVT